MIHLNDHICHYLLFLEWFQLVIAILYSLWPHKFYDNTARSTTRLRTSEHKSKTWKEQKVIPAVVQELFLGVWFLSSSSSTERRAGSEQYGITGGSFHHRSKMNDAKRREEMTTTGGNDKREMASHTKEFFSKVPQKWHGILGMYKLSHFGTLHRHVCVCVCVHVPSNFVYVRVCGNSFFQVRLRDRVVKFSSTSQKFRPHVVNFCPSFGDRWRKK